MLSGFLSVKNRKQSKEICDSNSGDSLAAAGLPAEKEFFFIGHTESRGRMFCYGYPLSRAAVFF